MTSIPSEMKAYVYSNGSATLKTVPVPTIGPNQVLIKVRAAAMNPTDWKHIVYRMYAENDICGCDFAGEVVKVGDAVTNTKVGDCAYGVWSGAFSEYIAVYDNMWFVPPNKKLTHSSGDEIAPGPLTTFEAAASLGVSVLTCGIAFGHYAGLLPLAPTPRLKDEFFLVWGASSSLGQLALQFGKYYGYQTIATCSPYNFEHIKSLGADHVIDYKDPQVVEKIRKIAGDNITLSYDTVVVAPSSAHTYELMSSSKPALMLTSLAFDPTDSSANIKAVKPNVKVDFPLGYFVFQEEKRFGDVVYKRPEGLPEHFFAFSAEYNKQMAQDPAFVKHIPIKVLPNGFDSIEEGLSTLQQDKNKGVKIVVRLD